VVVEEVSVVDVLYYCNFGNSHVSQVCRVVGDTFGDGGEFGRWSTPVIYDTLLLMRWYVRDGRK
jgi:hypothetical protein